jgi:hypothetical protein
MVTTCNQAKKPTQQKLKFKVFSGGQTGTAIS